MMQCAAGQGSNGQLTMDNGKWKMENGELKVESAVMSPPNH
jgi:hypothetical protein